MTVTGVAPFTFGPFSPPGAFSSSKSFTIPPTGGTLTITQLFTVAMPAGTPRGAALNFGSIPADGHPVLAAVAPTARTATAPSSAAPAAAGGATTVTAFASIINNSSSAATDCQLAVPFGTPATFLYQTTNPSTNEPTGTANTPVNIPANQTQSFYFALDSTSVASQDIPIQFLCLNKPPGDSVTGLNTFLLSALQTQPADMVAVAVTPSHDAIVNIPVTGSNPSLISFFTTAAINIGSAQPAITFTPTDAPFGGSSANLPVTLSICRTGSNGVCLAPPAGSVTTAVAVNETLFFSVFANVANASVSIPFDPAFSRLYFRATQGSTPVGQASVAVRTQ